MCKGSFTLAKFVALPLDKNASTTSNIHATLIQGAQKPGNSKGGSITVLLTSCLTGLDKSVLQIKTKIVSCDTANSNPVKQEVNSTLILPPLVFPDKRYRGGRT